MFLSVAIGNDKGHNLSCITQADLPQNKNQSKGWKKGITILNDSSRSKNNNNKRTTRTSIYPQMICEDKCFLKYHRYRLWRLFIQGKLQSSGLNLETYRCLMAWSI